MLPLHSGYALLLRLWMRRFGAAAPCEGVGGELDFSTEECLPFVFPLQTVRPLCEGAKGASKQLAEYEDEKDLLAED